MVHPAWINSETEAPATDEELVALMEESDGPEDVIAREVRELIQQGLNLHDSGEYSRYLDPEEREALRRASARLHEEGGVEALQEL